ncbi:hypothetical protein E4U54_007500, partial [Claviceps lovelessii]
MTLIDGWLWATWGPWEVGDGGDGIEKCASVSVNRQDKTTAAAVREHVKSASSVLQKPTCAAGLIETWPDVQQYPAATHMHDISRVYKTAVTIMGVNYHAPTAEAFCGIEDDGSWIMEPSLLA